MTDIIRIVSIEPCAEMPGLPPLQLTTTTYEVYAYIDDIVQTLPARIYPADLAHPAEFGPAECKGEFQVEHGEEHPPLNAPIIELIDYVDQRIDTWTPIEVSDF